MANTRFVIRRTSVAGRAANSTYINAGELGLNLPDQILYSMDASNNVFIIGANVVSQDVTNNMWVGNSSVNIAVNSTSFSLGGSITVNTATIMVGNSTVNNVINSTAVLLNQNSTINATVTGNNISSSGNAYFTVISTNTTSVPLTVRGAASATANLFQVSNSGSVVFAVNSTGVMVGNGFGITSVTASVVGNSGIVSNATGIYANLTSNNTVGGLQLTAAGGLAVLANTGITSNSSGLFAAGGSVAGANQQIQFNDSAVANGDANLTWNKTSALLTVGNATINTSINSTVHLIGAINSSAVGVSLANSLVTIGNSSVNATINSTTFSGTSLTANNATNLGGVTSGSYINTSGNYIITGIHTYGNLTVNSVINSTAYLIGAINTSAVGLTLANNLITLGNSSVNATINSTTFSGTSLTANNATNLGGVAAASYINTSGSYVISGFHTYGNLTVNVVITNTSVAIGAINTSAVGLTLANNLFTVGNSSVNTTINSTAFSGTANNSSYLGGTAAASYQQTGAPLTNNVATMSANNSSYLGGVAAASYINTSGSYLSTGVLSFGNSTVNNVINSTALLLNQNSTINATMTGNNISSSGNAFFTIVTSNTTSVPLTVRGAASATANLFQVSNSGSVVFAINSTGVMVGNGAGLTSIISAQNLVATATATGAVPLSAVGAASATANLFQVSNSGSVVFAINSTGVIVGNGFGITSVTASVVANSGIVSNATGIYANLTSNNTVGGLQLASGGLCILANTGITANSSGLFAAGGSIAGSNTQIQFNDSATANGDANLTWNKTTADLTVGNSTVNVSVNTSSVTVGNLSVSVSAPSIVIGNSSVNTFINSSAIVANGNSLTTLNAASLTAGDGMVCNASGIFNELPTKSFDILLPAAGDSYTIFWTKVALTLSEISVVLGNSSTGAWANLGFFYGTDRTTATTANAAANVANVTVGVRMNSANFAATAIPANGFFWCNVGGMSPNTDEIHCTVRLA